jgi:hypothetical protein
LAETAPERHDDYSRRLPAELSDDCILIEETGECVERELIRGDGQVEKFYRDLKQRGTRVRVGMEDRLGREMLPMLRKGECGNALLHPAQQVHHEIQRKVK